MRFWALPAVLLACGCGQSEAPAANRAACPHGPVVLVHGLDQGPEIFGPMIEGLANRGIDRQCLHAVQFSEGNLPIRIAAEHELATFVDQIVGRMEESRAESGRATQPARVNLVGHSMGALSTRWFAARVRPERVRVWVSTSGANHGTDWQCERAPGGGHGDMCPAFARSEAESAVQFALNGGPAADIDETPFGYGHDNPGVQSRTATAARAILYMTVQAADDEYIKPQTSLSIDGAGGVDLPALERHAGLREISPGNFLLTEPNDHDGLLASDAVIDLIFQAVTADLPLGSGD